MSKPSIGTYVLAGGRSSRMGLDKALLPLAGRPLIEHAVRKLGRLSDDVHILGSRAELARFGSPVPDLHEGCGPLGGIEAALTHTCHELTLIFPVDMPFLPAALLLRWSRSVLEQGRARAALFVVDGVPQPTV